MDLENRLGFGENIYMVPERGSRKPFENKKICIFSFEHSVNDKYTVSSGPLPFLVDYFKTASTLCIIEQPLPTSDSGYIKVKYFTNGTITKCFQFLWPWCGRGKFKIFSSEKTYIYLKLRDIISFIWFFFRLRLWRFDIVISMECLNAALACLIFPKRVYKIYYIFDWAPDRYRSLFFNKIYLTLDKVSTYKSHVTWNVAPTIPDYKLEFLGYHQTEMSDQKVIPYCYAPSYSNHLNDFDSNLLVYSGGLIEENGVEILIQAIVITAKKIPQCKFLIIGEGSLGGYMRKTIKDRSLSSRVHFTGYIADPAKILELQSRCAAGLAPYPALVGSRKPFGDVIKVRMYIASGIPVLSTNVIPTSKEISEYKIGLVSKSAEAAAFADICLETLSNRDLLVEMRKNVRLRSKTSSWSSNFNQALLDYK